MRGQEQAAAPRADASRLRIAIIVARFNAFVTDRLRDGAVAALREAGAPESAIEIFSVPGAFEIPQAARAAAETGRFDAVVCLGCLIRGETPHFDYIASAAAHGITAAAGDTGVPMAFGVLTTNTTEQAVERAGEGPDNKGREAAAAAIEMATLYRTLASTQSRPSGFRV
jgi:6,7-dimethyl-8-ribityllumazine synthase